MESVEERLASLRDQIAQEETKYQRQLRKTHCLEIEKDNEEISLLELQNTRNRLEIELLQAQCEKNNHKIRNLRQRRTITELIAVIKKKGVSVTEICALNDNPSSLNLGLEDEAV